MGARRPREEEQVDLDGKRTLSLADEGRGCASPGEEVVPEEG
jgi:hypothetical protein